VNASSKVCRPLFGRVAGTVDHDRWDVPPFHGFSNGGDEGRQVRRRGDGLQLLSDDAEPLVGAEKIVRLRVFQLTGVLLLHKRIQVFDVHIAFEQGVDETRFLFIHHTNVSGAIRANFPHIDTLLLGEVVEESSLGANITLKNLLSWQSKEWMKGGVNPNPV
jgi:hypothetical protein